MLDVKKNMLKELCNNHNKEFVEHINEAEEKTAFTKMKFYLTKCNDLKRKAEDFHHKSAFVFSSTSNLVLFVFSDVFSLVLSNFFLRYFVIADTDA